MDMKQIIADHDFVLMEAAVIETLRRSAEVRLHPILENALLIYEAAGQETLSALYRDFIAVAHAGEVPIAVCTPTWRANHERLSSTGLTRDVNGDAVRFLLELKRRCGAWADNILIGGLLGCKYDCYKPNEGLAQDDAKAFHRRQIDRLAGAGVDFLLGATLPAVPEATGMALAMAETGVPYIISFVIDRQGRILDGTPLVQAFGEIDTVCRKPPLGYMINCAYPSFLNARLQPPAIWSRLIGFQANASSLDHSQLDGAGTLQAEALSDWGDRMVALNKEYGVKIMGGCCGTSYKHLQYLVSHVRDTKGG